MVLVEELHVDAATDDLLASAGDLQSFFDHLGLEVAAAGGGEGAEEELEWLSNKDAFPTVDTMEPEAALMGPQKKVVRGRRRRLRRRGDEDLDWLPNKDAFLEGGMAKAEPAITKVVRRRRWAEEGLDRLPNKDASPAVGMVDVDPKPAVKKVVRRRWRRRADEDIDWIPNKDAFLDVDTAQPETAVTKIVLRRRRAGASIVPAPSEPGRRRPRRADEEVEWMPNKHAFLDLEAETAETQPAVKKVVRRRLRRRPKEELDWLPKKDALLEVEKAELETVVTKMVLRPRRAGPSIAPTAAKPRQRRCSRCGRRKTPHWRAGPEGPRTLCNACGKRYRSERLVPVYGPLSSATIRPAPELQSNMPRRIVQMCRSSATLVDVVVRSASPTHHLSRSPARTKEAVCKNKPLRGDIQPSFDQAGLEVASGVGGEDEELEWPSNGDALPVLETMEPEPRVKEVARQRQPAAELGQRWCQHCGSMKKPQWRQGAAEEEQERDWLSNKDVPVMETREPKPSVLVRPRRRAVIASSSSPSATADKLGQRRCRHCGTTESHGPEGRHTLCNACGIRIRYRSGGLVPEYRPLGSPTFYPELHSNSAQDALCRRGSSSAASPLTPSHK